MLNITWDDTVENETLRETRGQDVLEKTLPRWFGNEQRMEDSRSEKYALFGFLAIKETEFDHTLPGTGNTGILPGKTLSGETLNQWTRHGKASVSRRLTWKNGKNRLPDVIVTGWTKV